MAAARASLAAEFAERFAIEVRRGSTGIALFHNATETKWFQGLAANASALCMPRRGVRFLDPSGNKRPGGPLQGQILLYFGDDVEAFPRRFQHLRPDIGLEHVMTGRGAGPLRRRLPQNLVLWLADADRAQPQQ